MPDDVTPLPAGDPDEELTRLLTYEATRRAAAAREVGVREVLDALEFMSTAALSTAPAWQELTKSITDDVELASAELLMRQQAYRSAAAAIEEPVAPSLAAFLV